MQKGLNMTTGTATIARPPGYPAAAECMVFVLPDVDPAISAALTVSGLRVSSFDAEAVQAVLADTTADRAGCAIVWPDPAALVARTLEDGHIPFAIAGNWRLAAQQVLDIYRRNRRRVVLVDARLFGDGGDAGRAQLARRLGLSAQILPAPDVAAPDAVSMALAASVLPRLPDVEACLEELLSSSLSPATEATATVDLTTLGAEYVRLTAAAKEIDLLRQQRDHLALRVRDLTSKLEKVFASTSWRATKPLRKVKGLFSQNAPSVDLTMAHEKRLNEDALSSNDWKTQSN